MDSGIEEKRDRFFRSFFIGVAVSSLIFLAAVFIPFFGAVFLLMSPLPTLFFYSKTGRIQGAAILAISLCLIALILWAGDLLANFPVLCVSGCLGILLAELLKKNYSIEKTVFYPAILLLAIWISFMLYQGSIAGMNPWRLMESYLSRSIHEMIQFYAGLGVQGEHIDLIKNNSKQIVLFFLNIFPALSLIGAVFAVWINILAGRELLKKGALQYADFGDLSCWKAPEKLVWILIVSGGSLLVPLEVIQFWGLNILLVCSFIYLLQGLSIANFLFKRRNVHVLVRAIFYFLVFAQQYVMILVIVVGLVDLWIDFRKYLKPATG